MIHKKNLKIVLYLFLGALSIEVVILARQNMQLKRTLFRRLERPKKIEGMIVPPLKVLTLDGSERMILYNNESRRTLLFVFTTASSNCLRNIPHWRRMTEILKDDSTIQIFGVAMKSEPFPVNNYVKGYELNYPVVMASPKDTTLENIYQIKSVPKTFLISDSSKIIMTISGVLTRGKQNDIINKIDENKQLKI